MKNNKILITFFTAILFVCFLLLVLEKFHIINFYNRPVVSGAGTTTRPVNSVDYTPQTSPPDPTINSEKNPQKSNSTSTQSASATMVTITRANQDPVSNNLNIGVLIDGVTSGTCNLDLLKDSKIVLSKSATVTTQSGLITCAGFTVLANEIPNAGTYAVKVSIGNESATQNVELTK